jgi:hypothetical protein
LDGAREGSAEAGSARALFTYVVRREGRTIATIEAREGAGGVVVESEVFPISRPHDEPGVKRPFTFSSADQARRFADDALVAFEYLNCTIT